MSAHPSNSVVLVWYQLVDSHGNIYLKSTVSTVVLHPNSIVDQLRDAILSKNSAGILRGISSCQLLVFKDRLSFDTHLAPLDEDSAIQGLGTSKRDALWVVVPWIAVQPPPSSPPLPATSLSSSPSLAAAIPTSSPLYLSNLHPSDSKRHHPYDIRDFIFHTKEANCVTAVRRTLAVTFAHGPHSQLSLYDIVSIYSPSTKVEHKLKVVFINKSFDLIVLESPQPLCPADPILRLPAAGEAYIQLSITQPYSTPAISATRGLILSSHLVGSGQILGSAQPAVGDLAGGCFHEASGALIGLYMGIVQDPRSLLNRVIIAPANLILACLPQTDFTGLALPAKTEISALDPLPPTEPVFSSWIATSAQPGSFPQPVPSMSSLHPLEMIGHTHPGAFAAIARDPVPAPFTTVTTIPNFDHFDASHATAAMTMPKHPIPSFSDGLVAHSALAIRSPKRLAAPGPSSHPPAYQMSRTILTVPEAWREYTDGIDGGPAIQQLEQRWGARWRSSHKEMKFFCRRNIIYVYILEQLNKRPLDEILAELETMRNNSSLNALSNKLKKMKQESEKENTK